MNVSELLEALKKADLGLSLSVEGREAVSVKLSGKTVNVDIKDPASIGKAMKKLK